MKKIKHKNKIKELENTSISNENTNDTSDSKIDFELKNLEVKELGDGEFGCTYLVKNNNKKYIFKFTFENVRFRLGFKYKGKDFKFTKPGEIKLKLDSKLIVKNRIQDIKKIRMS